MAAEIYDPESNTWSNFAVPDNFPLNWRGFLSTPAPDGEVTFFTYQINIRWKILCWSFKGLYLSGGTYVDTSGDDFNYGSLLDTFYFNPSSGEFYSIQALVRKIS